MRMQRVTRSFLVVSQPLAISVGCEEGENSSNFKPAYIDCNNIRQGHRKGHTRS
ncbi:hypothetical protein BDR03DRAFT_943697 [Suillus americanus]|nr:hypothetical protein BDR03DRAFT_943697 [Suillus americanus]